MDEEQLGGAAPQEAGIDIEAQIQDGVAAFMQSQDPAIAVEVVTMMASMMGIAPAVDPFADQGAAPAGPMGAQAPAGPPMARNGMKMYRAGGRIKSLKNGGGPGDKVAHVSRHGDTVYEAPEVSLDLPVVNRNGKSYYRLGRTKFQKVPGEKYDNLSKISGKYSGNEKTNVLETPTVPPLIASRNKSHGDIKSPLGYDKKNMAKSIRSRIK